MLDSFNKNQFEQVVDIAIDIPALKMTSDMYYLTIESLIKLENYSKALELSNFAVKYYPADIDLMLERIIALISMNCINKAKRELKRFKNIVSNYDVILKYHYICGSLCLKNNDLKNALSTFKSLYETEQPDKNIHIKYIHCLIESKSINKSKEVLDDYHLKYGEDYNFIKYSSLIFKNKDKIKNNLEGIDEKTINFLNDLFFAIIITVVHYFFVSNSYVTKQIFDFSVILTIAIPLYINKDTTTERSLLSFLFISLNIGIVFNQYLTDIKIFFYICVFSFLTSIATLLARVYIKSFLSKIMFFIKNMPLLVETSLFNTIVDIINPCKAFLIGIATAMSINYIMGQKELKTVILTLTSLLILNIVVKQSILNGIGCFTLSLFYVLPFAIIFYILNGYLYWINIVIIPYALSSAKDAYNTNYWIDS